MKIILLLALVIFSSSLNEEYRKVKLDDIIEDSYIPIKLGQKIIIEMEGNPTTGFIWVLSNTEHLHKVKPLNLDEKFSGEYFAGGTSMGTGGIYHFKFQGKEVGNDVLIFKYQRPWDKEGSTSKSVNLIVVHPDL